MTEEGNLSNASNQTNEQETVESDVESDCSDERSNITTDDEFYNELMSAPAELEDHLIPDGCTDENIGIDHLTVCLNRRYNACPVFFTGTLKDAIKEAFSSTEIKERRSLLIYINNDKSVYSNLFCKQLLCHEKIIDFLLNNYVLWAWDVTFPSNGEKLDDIYKKAFPQWNVDEHIGTKSIERYPLFIGLSRNKNGDYIFKYLIDGSNKRPVIDEFLGQLIQHKDQFDDNEEDYEREKSKPQQSNNLFGTMDFHQPSKYPANRDFLRAVSMHYQPNATQFSRFSSHDNDPFFLQPRSHLSSPFRQMTLRPSDNDGDDEDDDDDEDDGKTPTVERPSPKFPKE